VVQRVGDAQEVLEELAREILVGAVLLGELERDAHQIEAIHRHPRRRVGLLEAHPGRQRLAPVEDRDVVEPEEAALEDVVAS